MTVPSLVDREEIGNMRVEFNVPGRPQGKDRPRAVFQGGRIHTYTTKKTRSYENEIREAYLESANGTVFDGCISMKIMAYFPIPKATKKSDREQMLKGRVLPCKKPDTDNIAKIICDALNGTAYADDKQVVELSVCKRYVADEPYVRVSIEASGSLLE